MNYRDTSERKQMLRSSSAPETVIVGKTVISGLLFFAEEEAGNKMKTKKSHWHWHLLDTHRENWKDLVGDDLIETFGIKPHEELHQR